MNGPPAPPAPPAPTPPVSPPKLLDHVRAALRQRAPGQDAAPRERDREQAWLHWLARFLRFHGLRHPKELGSDHVAGFLATLHDRPAEQAVATAALRFLYVEFLPTDPVPPPPAPVRPAGPAPTRSPFLNRCHEVLRLRHYSLRGGKETARQGDGVHVATRQCRSERRESCGDFAKFSSLPSGCKSRPTTAEPGRSAVSLAVGPVTARLMRRQTSSRAVGPQPRNRHSSREAEGVCTPEGGRGRHRSWARRRPPRRGVRPRHVRDGQSGNLGGP
jgi:hypothetical protein